MAVDCEETRSLMLELLYGELAQAAQAEVAAHVAACPACRTELAALESTRALARRALDADVPPPRARAAILRAAAAAMPGQAVAAQPGPAPSFWSRIRAKWTLPTLATVGAVAVLLLASRIFLEPEKTYERGRQGLVPAPTEPPPPEPAAPTAASPVSRPSPVTSKGEAAEPPAKSRSRFASPPPAYKRRVSPPAAPPARRAESPKDSLDDLLEAKRLSPPPVVAAPRAATAAQPDRGPSKKVFEDDILEGSAGARSAREGAGAPAAAKAEAPAARAARLFAARRWVEAADAYRNLLRTDPDNPAAGQWRQRLGACEAAVASPP